MPNQLTGTFGDFRLIGGRDRIAEINLDTATRFFLEMAVKKGDIFANSLGLFSFLEVGRDGKAKLAELTVPRNLLQSRKNCATWTPKGRMYLRPGEIDTTPIEFMGEQCADAFIGECLEKLLPTGSNVWDFTGTPEGRAIFGAMIEGIYLGVGNSINDLLWFGQYSVTSSSNSSGWWNTGEITQEEWDDYIDQQVNAGLKGWVTLIEEEKTAGNTSFTVNITGDFTGPDYTGSDITEIFNSVKAAAKTPLKTAYRNRTGPQVAYLVSYSIFDAYKDYLLSQYPAIPDAYQMQLGGETVPGILMYDSVPVIAMDEWAQFDEYNGVNSHRCLLMAMGNLAAAADVVPLPQYDGAGLVVQKKADLSSKGKTEMYAQFRIGTAIPDTRFMANGSVVLTP